MNRYYKGKFSIGLYNDDDELIALFDNAEQLAKYLQRDYKSVRCSVCNHDKVVVNNKKYNLELIDMIDDEEAENKGKDNL